MRIPAFTRFVLGICAARPCSLGARLARPARQGRCPTCKAPTHCVRSRNGGRQDHAHRLHRSREPQLQQPLLRLPGAYTVTEGKDSKGQTIKLTPSKLGADYDIDHSVEAMIEACNGTGKLPGTDCRMNGFDKEFVRRRF